MEGALSPEEIALSRLGVMNVIIGSSTHSTGRWGGRILRATGGIL